MAAPIPVLYSSLDGKSSWKRSSNFRLLLLLLLPPVTIYLILINYAPHIISLDGLSYNHCSPQDFTVGDWIRKSEGDLVEEGEGIYQIGGFEGCASKESADRQLGVEGPGPVTGKRKSQSSFVWQPSKNCKIGAFQKETMVRDLVEKGGWLIVGDSSAETQFFSLSCMLYPHVIHSIADGVQDDMSRIQSLYLNPSSNLIPTLNFPTQFNLQLTPLISLRRSDLLFSRPELLKIQRSLHPHSQQYPPVFTAGVTWDRSLSSYLSDFLTPLPLGNYRALIVDTGSVWTTNTFAFPNLPAIVTFFQSAMEKWVEKVAEVLDKGDETKRRRVLVKAYAGGHDRCENIIGPIESSQLSEGDDWNWSKEFNYAVENATSANPHKRIHYLDLLRPSRLRPDAHLRNDCFHIAVGTGVVEGWSEYINHFLSGGYNFMDYVPEKGKELGNKLKGYIPELDLNRFVN